MQATRTTLRNLAGLKELGVRLVLDHFGAGLLLAAALQRTSRSDMVKIDRSFVAKLAPGRRRPRSWAP